ncbi:hypothetical protein Tco_0070827 [Tanacetum coccineum]
MIGMNLKIQMKLMKKMISYFSTKIPINPVPVATKSPSIANYKIIKQGRKGVYQIVRENGTDMKHGMNEPEDEFEKVLWEYLKNMFEEPLSTDSIWSLPGQQRIILLEITLMLASINCLNLELQCLYANRRNGIPLSAEVAKLCSTRNFKEENHMRIVINF